MVLDARPPRPPPLILPAFAASASFAGTFGAFAQVGVQRKEPVVAFLAGLCIFVLRVCLIPRLQLCALRRQHPAHHGGCGRRAAPAGQPLLGRRVAHRHQLLGLEELGCQALLQVFQVAAGLRLGRPDVVLRMGRRGHLRGQVPRPNADHLRAIPSGGARHEGEGRVALGGVLAQELLRHRQRRHADGLDAVRGPDPVRAPLLHHPGRGRDAILLKRRQELQEVIVGLHLRRVPPLYGPRLSVPFLLLLLRLVIGLDFDLCGSFATDAHSELRPLAFVLLGCRNYRGDLRWQHSRRELVVGGLRDLREVRIGLALVRAFLRASAAP
mmetsp:Transcript_37701/g.105002  ORF Transcript_37701/g.105002 Transcript_37701/m.105002 type:complete len:326 (+) Transcript_37701:1430-2407(+)